MTFQQFISAARRRAVPVAVACVADPASPNSVRAVLYTEFSFAFVQDDAETPLLALFITSLGSAIARIRAEGQFSLSILRADNVSIASQVVDKTHTANILDFNTALPSVKGADTVFFCVYRNDTLFADNDYSLVLAEIDDAIQNSENADPLLNHVDHYWRLERRSLLSARGNNPNPRILNGS